MQFSSRLPIAAHILMCIVRFGEDCKITSDFLAGSVNVNPVIIRKTLGQLKKAGLVRIEAGVGGAAVDEGRGGGAGDERNAAAAGADPRV